LHFLLSRLAPPEQPKDEHKEEPKNEKTAQCVVKLSFTSVWQDGYIVEVYVVNTGDAMKGWKVKFKLPARHMLEKNRTISSLRKHFYSVGYTALNNTAPPM
jgi:hypothetical protein